MLVYQLSEAEYTNILKEISMLRELLESPLRQQKPFIDNEEFMDLMRVSKRTAQKWRDEGLIAFSQVGNKIYYRMEDIDLLLKNHLIKAYRRPRGNI